MINSEPSVMSGQLMRTVFLVSHLYFFIIIIHSLFPFPFHYSFICPIVLSRLHSQTDRAASEHHGTCGLLILVLITHKLMQELVCEPYVADIQI